MFQYWNRASLRGRWWNSRLVKPIRTEEGHGHYKDTGKKSGYVLYKKDDTSFGRHAFSNSPIFYAIHYILSSGGFASSCFRPSRTVSPILDALGRHVCCWSLDNLTTSFTHRRQCKYLLHFVPPLHGTVVVVSSHMRCMLHVISVICYLMRICVCTSYYCELVVRLGAQLHC